MQGRVDVGVRNRGAVKRMVVIDDKDEHQERKLLGSGIEIPYSCNEIRC